MHDIEPHYHWREKYIASEDKQSPFFNYFNNEFQYHNKIYNYYIHPQWDNFGSQTLYTKLIYTDYDEGYAVFEMIGEWNDCIHNDIMFFKRDVIDPMLKEGIHKYIIICENVLNFHGSDDCYYEEWYEDVLEEDGWICFVNTLNHVEEELKDTGIMMYVNFGERFNTINWRPHKPERLYESLDTLIKNGIKRLNY